MMPYGYFKENPYTYLWPNFVVGYSFLWFSVDPKLTYSHLRLNLLKPISQLKIIVLFKGKVLILYQLSIYLVATFYAYYLCRKHKKMEIYFELYQMMSIWRKRIENPYTHLRILAQRFWKNPDGVLWSPVVFVVVVAVTLSWPPRFLWMATHKWISLLVSYNLFPQRRWLKWVIFSLTRPFLVAI